MCQFLLIFPFYPWVKYGNSPFEVQQNFLLDHNRKAYSTHFFVCKETSNTLILGISKGTCVP